MSDGEYIRQADYKHFSPEDDVDGNLTFYFFWIIIITTDLIIIKNVHSYCILFAY